MSLPIQSTRYCCKSPLRIEAVREHPSLNGLEYLEVIDRDAPSADLRQRTLLIRTVKPLLAAPTLPNWQLSGGQRVKAIRLEWVELASKAPDLFSEGLISASERDYLLEQDEPDTLIVIRTEKTGDYSTYQLCLGSGASPSTTPFAGFDLRSSCIDFSFKVECPSPFDCAPDRECNEVAALSPAIDYLVKDYQSFRQLMLNRLSVTLPKWTDRSPADIGMAIVEVLAEEADEISQFQDAVSTEAYLSSARRRTSLRRHARMLDYQMHEGANARAFVTLKAENAIQNLEIAQTLATGESVRILSRVGKLNALLDPASAEKIIIEKRPLVFEPMHALRVFTSHNRIRLHTWGDKDCVLQKGDTHATLIDSLSERLHLMPGDFLIFEEVLSPVTGQAADADPKKRHVVRLTEVTPSAIATSDGSRSPGLVVMDELMETPVVEIVWEAKDALPFCVVVSAATELDGILTEIDAVSVARGNVLLCDQGYTIPGAEILDNVEADFPFRPQLHERNLSRVQTVAATLPDYKKTWATASQLRRHNPGEALPAITLLDRSDLVWTPRPDLLDSDRFDTHFVVEREDDGLETLRFGDGLYAMSPETSAEGLSVRFEARYRIGNGTQGNCGSEALAHLVHIPGAGIQSLRNPLAAEGGLEPQTRESVRIAAPEAFRTQLRAVTPEDYVSTVEKHPEVQKASAIRRWTGSWHTVFLSVDRKAGLEVDDAFEAELVGFLESYRLACHDVEIAPPEMLALDIALNVCVEPDAEASRVEERLLKLFSADLLEENVLGFFHPDRWTFGTPLYLSDLIASAQALDGVSHVTIDPSLSKPGRFHPWAEIQRDEIERGIIDPGSRRILRCDNDPNAPEQGRIQFFMMGGL